MNAKKKVSYAFNDYVVEVEHDEDGCFVLTIPLLPGCMSVGSTLDEAYNELEEAFKDWTEDAVAHGEHIPAPTKDAEYSGRIVLRMPKSLHARAARAAEREGVSLNALLINVVSAGVQNSIQVGRLEQMIAALQVQMADVRSSVARTASVAAQSSIPPGTWSVSGDIDFQVQTMPVTYLHAFCQEEKVPGYRVRIGCAGEERGVHGG